MTTKATKKDEAASWPTTTLENYEQLERDALRDEQGAPESATEFPFGHIEPKGTPPEKKDPRPRRTRGTGSVFRKPPCKLWVIQFYRNGRRVREATGTADIGEAKRLLRQRLHEVDQNTYLARRGRPAKVADLYEALKAEREANRKGRKRELPGRWRHLGPAFGAMPAADVTTDDVLRYVSQRRARDNAANATINRELAALKRMFRLGSQATPPRVQRVPHIPLLREANARSGFVEDTGFGRLALVAEAGGEPWLRLFLELAYSYGWRRGELLGLRCGQVNLAEGTIRLDPGTTKNREGREVAIEPTSRLATLLRAALAGKRPDDYVLTRTRNRPVRDFRAAWRGLCVRAGLGRWECRACASAVEGTRCKCGSRRSKYQGLIPHDLRRSAAKALRAAGVPESVVMAIGGWKTNTMFRRYAIVSSADQRAAVEMLERARAQRSIPVAQISVVRLQPETAKEAKPN